MSVGTIFGILAVSIFALMLATSCIWAIVKVVAELAGCEDDTEEISSEAIAPEVVSAGYHANAELHPPCRT